MAKRKQPDGTRPDSSNNGPKLGGDLDKTFRKISPGRSGRFGTAAKNESTLRGLAGVEGRAKAAGMNKADAAKIVDSSQNVKQVVQGIKREANARDKANGIVRRQASASAPPFSSKGGAVVRKESLDSLRRTSVGDVRASGRAEGRPVDRRAAARKAAATRKARGK